jgi:hypothetical protein
MDPSQDPDPGTGTAHVESGHEEVSISLGCAKVQSGGRIEVHCILE